MGRAWVWAVMMVLGGATAGLSQEGGRDVAVPASLPNGTLVCAVGETLVLAGPDTVRDFARCVLSADRHLLPGQSQDADPLNPNYTLRWTAGEAGTHRLSLDYVLANGNVTNARRFVVQVMESAPVVLEGLPAVFYGASQGKDLPVSVRMAPGFRAVRVRYFLDGALVGESTEAGLGCVLPLGGVLTGTHRVCLQATNASGDVYISPVAFVTAAGGTAPGDLGAKTVAAGTGARASLGGTGAGKKPVRRVKRRAK